MKIKILISILLIHLVFGCSSKYYINHNSSDNNVYEINKILKYKKGQIFLLDGRNFSGYNILFGLDTTSWTVNKNASRQTIQTKAIKEIIFMKRGRGAGQGFSFGAILGGGITTVSILRYPDYYQDIPGIPYIVFNAFVWGCAGIIIGTTFGSRDVYIFNNNTNTPNVDNNM